VASTTIDGLGEATEALAGAVLGPADLARVLGFDPLSVLTDAERAAVARVPFSAADYAQARAAGEFLVLRLPRDPDGPLSMLALAKRVGGMNPRVHEGVGYMLRDEWTIDPQPFAKTETCAAGWFLVRREPVRETLNLFYREQDAALERLGLPSRPGVSHRRSAVEVAFDTLCWHAAHGERLLGRTWDWSRSPSSDGGLVAMGEFGDKGLGCVAYSRAVKHNALGICAQR
jgi:hypothetical protein